MPTNGHQAASGQSQTRADVVGILAVSAPRTRPTLSPACPGWNSRRSSDRNPAPPQDAAAHNGKVHPAVVIGVLERSRDDLHRLTRRLLLLRLRGVRSRRALLLRRFSVFRRARASISHPAPNVQNDVRRSKETSGNLQYVKRANTCAVARGDRVPPRAGTLYRQNRNFSCDRAAHRCAPLEAKPLPACLRLCRASTGHSDSLR